MTKSTCCSRRVRISSGSFIGSASPGNISVEDSKRLAQLSQERLRHGVLRDAQTDGLAVQVLQPTGDLARRAEDESKAPRCGRLQQTVSAVIDPSVARDLRQVAADQREVVAGIYLPDGANPFHGLLVADAATERVAGVSRIHDQPTVPYDVRGPLDQPLLRVRRMDDEILCHASAINRSARCIQTAPEDVIVNGRCLAAFWCHRQRGE